MEERLAVGEIARYALKKVNILKNTNKHIPAKDIIEIIERGCDTYKIPMSNIDISFSIDGGLIFFKLDSYLKSFIEDKNIIDVSVSARNNKINRTNAYYTFGIINSMRNSSEGSYFFIPNAAAFYIPKRLIYSSIFKIELILSE